MDLGDAYGPFDATVDAGQAAAFAQAINQPANGAVPPTFIAAVTRGAMLHAMTHAVPAEAQRRGVHGEQDMRWYRPLEVGMALRTTAQVRSLRVGKTGSRLTLSLESRDEDGRPVADQLWTTFLRGADLGRSMGPDLPDHRLPARSGAGASAHARVRIDDDQPIRFARASGEDSSIHVDPAAAQASGFRTIIAHGMCSLALCAGAVVPDLTRLRRLAVRFSGVAYPGTELDVVSFTVLDDLTYAFEARAAREPVLTDGRIELVP